MIPSRQRSLFGFPYCSMVAHVLEGKQSRSADEDLCRLRANDELATGLGEGLGAGEVLLQHLSETEEWLT